MILYDPYSSELILIFYIQTSQSVKYTLINNSYWPLQKTHPYNLFYVNINVKYFFFISAIFLSVRIQKAKEKNCII